ncbi:hypothetical protein P872_18945 [Rhodonellum psychrophilum GCM71 = DSM 17998]|uniref:Uncharacterized protein n=2 Tax=Rhodonellum TaxID=336827 RepID=U5C255_9BACT|nr:hypothetical protein P872_18945 [Rhodonellum psychrophilum GCM71 = DSM 17998]SDZ25690.1 hypothetical protein SAMN05444412_108150 [Rhodonellum ikkaensis]
MSNFPLLLNSKSIYNFCFAPDLLMHESQKNGFYFLKP